MCEASAHVCGASNSLSIGSPPARPQPDARAPIDCSTPTPHLWSRSPRPCKRGFKAQLVVDMPVKNTREVPLGLDETAHQGTEPAAQTGPAVIAQYLKTLPGSPGVYRM